MLGAAGDERAALAVAPGPGPRVGGELEHACRRVRRPRSARRPARLRRRARDGRAVARSHRRRRCRAAPGPTPRCVPTRRATSTCSSRLVSRRAPTRTLRSSRPPSSSSAAIPGFDDSSTPSSGRSVREPSSTHPGRDASERVEVAPCRGAVQRLLLRFEVEGHDEGFGSREPGLGLGEPCVSFDAVRDREAHVGGPVHVPFATVHLAGKAAPAHVVGEAQVPRTDARQLLALGGPGRGGTDTHRTLVVTCAASARPVPQARPVPRARPARRAGARRWVHSSGAHCNRRRPRRLLTETAPRRTVEGVGPRHRRPRNRFRGTGRLSVHLRERRRAVARGSADMGIVLGGSGQGEQIAANKVHGARAALCNDLYTARMARAHNDANVLSIGARDRRARACRRDHEDLPRDDVRGRPRALGTSVAWPRSPPSRPRSPVDDVTPGAHRPRDRRHHPARARAPEHDDPAHRFGELHLTCSDRSAGLGAHEQVLGGLPGKALLRRQPRGRRSRESGPHACV